MYKIYIIFLSVLLLDTRLDNKLKSSNCKTKISIQNCKLHLCLVWLYKISYVENLFNNYPFYIKLLNPIILFIRKRTKAHYYLILKHNFLTIC